jgi:hypothetical protein
MINNTNPDASAAFLSGRFCNAKPEIVTDYRHPQESLFGSWPQMLSPLVIRCRPSNKPSQLGFISGGQPNGHVGREHYECMMPLERCGEEWAEKFSHRSSVLLKRKGCPLRYSQFFTYPIGVTDALEASHCTALPVAASINKNNSVSWG